MSFLLPFAAPFLVNAVVNTLASLVISRALSGGKSKARAQPSTTRVSEMVRAPMTPRRWVYGRSVTGGVIVFSHVIPGAPPFDDVMLLVVALADGPVDAVEAIYFNDEEVFSTAVLSGTTWQLQGRFAGTEVRVYDGTQTAADQALVAEIPSLWTQEHILRDTTYLVFRMQFSDAAYSSGMPNISARVRGRKVYDPRSGLTAWSDNWALCVRDYLLDPDGCACAADEIDETVIAAAATVCDESVPLAAGGSESRYRLNGTVDLSQSPAEVLETLAAAGGGAIVWSGGAFRAHAGQWDPPVWAIDADDLRGPLEVQFSVPRRDLANCARGAFNDLSTRQLTSYPDVAPSSWRDADLGDVIVLDRSYPMTTSASAAQRLAKIELSRSRAAPRVVLRGKMTLLAVQPWDVVSLAIDHLGWTSANTFRIVDWTLRPDEGGVDLVLRAETANLYAWDTEEEPLPAAPSTGLPASTSVAAPGVPLVTESLYQTTGSAGIKARAVVTWGASAGPFLDRYEVSFGGRVQMLPAGTTTAYYEDVAPGTYAVSVTARNTLGLASAASTATVTVSGLAALPSAITGLSLISSGGLALASWTQSTDLDVRIGGAIEFRWAPATSGAVWNDGIMIGDAPGAAVQHLLPLRTGTYFCKARDSGGRYSATAAEFTATEALVTGWSTVATVTEDPTFGGTKTNLTVNGGVLELAGATLFDSLAGNVDSLTGQWDALGGLSGTGTYLFGNTSGDLTTSITRRLRLEIAATATDASATLDDRAGDWDDWPGLYDGSVVEGWTVATYYRATDDDPAGTPAWGDWVPFDVAEAKGRAYEFKSEFLAASPQQQISVGTLEVLVQEAGT